MPSVLEELAGEDITLDAAHVTRRIADWRDRVDGLYADVAAWFPNFARDEHDSVEMNEPLMRSLGVSAVRFPILRLLENEMEIARWVPRGLWIIGANGRVDLFSRRTHYIVSDRADFFSSPRWEIVHALNRRDARSLTRAFLSTIFA